MASFTHERRQTEVFLENDLPEFFRLNTPSDVAPALVEYIGAVTEVAGPRGENMSKFEWDQLAEHASNSAPKFILRPGSSSPDNDEDRIRESLQRRCTDIFLGASAMTLVTLGEIPKEVSTTGQGTLIVVDESGTVVGGGQKHNPAVDPSYGDSTYYVLEKLGWAKAVEVLARQGSDWGEGYGTLTELLRSVGRIDSTTLPHVGAATAHVVPYSEAAKGRKRHANAYGSASSYTLDSMSVGELLADPRFFEQYKTDLEKGLFDNISDWLAGRVDTLVARRGNELYLGTELSTDFPYLDTPDYVNVDNN